MKMSEIVAMEKYLSALLGVALMISLCACGSQPDTPSSSLAEPINPSSISEPGAPAQSEASVPVSNPAEQAVPVASIDPAPPLTFFNGTLEVPSGISAQNADAPTYATEPPTQKQTDMQEQEKSSLQISVRAGNGDTIVFELNESSAAQELYNQLPLTLVVESFSTNEKIFYLPQALNAAGAPIAQSQIGALAYYAPWGNVVMFYDRFNPNSSLFGLGQAVFGADQIAQLSGTIEIDKL